MRILVGTLYCGENEFEECVESLKAQTHQDWEHFIVRNLPNKLAHETLYETFVSRAADFDLFLKLDADMVFEDPTMLERIEAYMKEHSYLDGITICVHDFFADVLIHGLHVYRSCVKWQRIDEKLFVDAAPLGADRFRIGVKELAPAASHCKNPSPFFAFHFGVHRGLKALGATDGSAADYLQSIEQVWDQFQRKRDSRLGLAVLGAELGLVGKFDVADLDFDNQHLHDVSALYESKSVGELTREITELRSRPPDKIRKRNRRILAYRVSKFFASVISGIKPTLVQCIPRPVRRKLRGWLTKS